MTQPISSPCWVPVGVLWIDGQPVVVQRQVARPVTTVPFWLRGAASPFGPHRLLPLDEAVDPGEDRAPAGFLFHMLRCGSTLACNLLGAFPEVVALSEPAVFLALLQRPGDPALRDSRLRRLMFLHTTALCGESGRLIVKWSSLANASMAELTSAFPTTRRVFIHRDPIEVMASCLDKPPACVARFTTRHFAPHLAPAREIHAVPFPELMARYLGSCCFHAAESTLLPVVDYRQLPPVAWGGLADYFGLRSASAETLAALKQESALNTKDRQQEFRADAERKRQSLSREGRLLAERFIVAERARLVLRQPSLT